jgi:hypothetical protein
MNEVARTGLQGTAPAETAEALPFLTRWSRRKLGQDVPDVDPQTHEATPAMAAEVPAVIDPPGERIDPRTGKPISELTDEDMPDIESLDENSDLAAFMASKVSNALRMKALTRVFHTAKFNQVCLCAEYADDYTNFTPLGDIVPHDLKQAIVREAGKLVERLTQEGLEITPEQAQARVAAEFRGERLPDIEAPTVRIADHDQEQTGQPCEQGAAQSSGDTHQPQRTEAT